MTLPGWDEGNFSVGSAWGNVSLYAASTAYEGPNQPGLAMTLHEMPPMGVQERRPPIKITKLLTAASPGYFVLPAGHMSPVSGGGVLRGRHRWPLLDVTNASSCQAACLNTPKGGCAQATWDATAPLDGLMTRVQDGYYDTSSLGIAPAPKALTEAACSAACLANKLCVQTTWTPPRGQERCDLYLVRSLIRSPTQPAGELPSSAPV